MRKLICTLALVGAAGVALVPVEFAQPVGCDLLGTVVFGVLLKQALDVLRGLVCHCILCFIWA